MRDAIWALHRIKNKTKRGGEVGEITRKPLFSFEEVEEELAKLREQIAREIEGLITEPHEIGESCSDCEFIRQAAAIARGKEEPIVPL